MSENENQPPAPSKQTSSIPLKKETIRVTLKASGSPPAVPSATVSMRPPLVASVVGPVRPPVPSGPATVSIASPKATVGPPTAIAGPPRPTAPAPTIPLRSAGAPAMAPAPTIRLASSTAPTGAIRPPGGLPSTALPKATVQLQPPTQSLGTTFPSSQAPALESDEEEEEEAGQGLVSILSGVGFAAALIVLAFQLMTAGTWINAEDNEKKGDWTQLSPL